MVTTTPDQLGTLRDAAHPIVGAADDHDALLEAIGDARLVLLGEASHGSHEHYAERARITRRLVEERGFAGVVVEADWPDASRVDAYVRAASADPDAVSALGDFRRFPTWMWRNRVVERFVAWLRTRNEGVREEDRVGFYGMDLYSLHGSVARVLEYLEEVDRRLPSGRGGATPASSTSASTTARPTATGLPPAWTSRARTMSSPSSSRCSSTRRTWRAGTGSWPRLRRSSRSRTPGWCATPRRTTGPCSAARSRRGTSATST